MRSHSAKFKRIEFVGAYLTCLRIAIVGFFLVGAKIRLLHEVGQALLRISFQALNLAAFYYHFRGGWWREIVSASSEDSRCKDLSNSSKNVSSAWNSSSEQKRIIRAQDWVDGWLNCFSIQS